MVQIENVHKTYIMGDSEVRALDGVTLDFDEGEFYSILGPSGSGKSTMLNLLGCLDRPTSGLFKMDGHDVSQMDDNQLSDLRLKRIGFIFQSFNLIPQLTVSENIALPLYYLEWDRQRSVERARELADRVGLGNRLGHRPLELSGGQQQRVAIARALANDPRIILADEPTGNLDSATGKQIMSLLSELNGQGKTIIMVTHEDEVAAHSNVRVHMRDGNVERIDRNA
ncbi:MAG: ABC transporter ATP-binding protein [Candidatus Hydrogenedentes bacterium]|nr:ABC transporter ATP-binding protein [Candidatus Hydrogenedentota bacterium]